MNQAAPQGKISAVIVGAGLMGRWHLDAARRSGAQVVCVVDQDLGRAQTLGGRGLARASLAEALQQPVDAVHICTPLETHVELAREALVAGCHVIVEKPAAPNADDAMALTDAGRVAGRMVVPVHQFIFQRGVQAMRSRLPALGSLRHFEFATASAGAEGSRRDPDAVAAEIVPHPLALARALLGVEVGALDWRLDRPAPGEWRINGMTDGGCSISVLISMQARPTFATCRLLGETGSAAADLFHGFAVFEPGTKSRRYKITRPTSVGFATMVAATAGLVRRAARREFAYPGLRALCTATYQAIRNQGPLPFAADEIVDVARATEKLQGVATPTHRHGG